MEKPYLLHLFTAEPNASPFDINMAYDAGYTAVIPYTGVTLGEITGLTQDVIFSRGPKGARRSGIFISSRTLATACDMLAAARKAMVPPFEASVFADPSGAFTTSAAMLASVESVLRKAHGAELEGRKVLVMGGSGAVGSTVAVLAAQAGAHVTLVGHDGVEKSRQVATLLAERFGVHLAAADGSSDGHKSTLLQDAEIVLATARAGVQVLAAAQLTSAPRLLVAADVNAVPPAGIEGIGVMDAGKRLDTPLSASGIGALAIGNVKYQVQQNLFKLMLQAEQAVYLDFSDALRQARKHV
ncbi:MAG: NAD(P)-dependent methylenetetrahydromethanopterin dehydrogenase [Burkholderiales bacterium]